MSELKDSTKIFNTPLSGDEFVLKEYTTQALVNEINSTYDGYMGLDAQGNSRLTGDLVPISVVAIQKKIKIKHALVSITPKGKDRITDPLEIVEYTLTLRKPDYEYILKEVQKLIDESELSESEKKN